MAARAGAVISDAEFVQFHPTAIDSGEDPAPLATEALRGESATLINRDGTRFMVRLHPDAELAPRDIVARAIFAETQAGRRPMLDARHVPDLPNRFPAVYEACRRAGIDPVSQPIPVAAAAHYHMGGIDVAATGRSSLPGLWACGEASATGLHGANRLASNGLLEALVYARRAAKDIAQELGAPKPTAAVSLTLPPGGQNPHEALIRDLRQVMPAVLRRSMTPDPIRGRLYDRGSEMACHPELARSLKIDIWFCDPHAPWQRGSNENTNGLRRYD